MNPEPVKADPSIPTSRTLTLLLLITLFALGLRVHALDAESLWMDEIVTVETYTRDPWGVVVAAAIEGQPPLDNFIGAVLYRVGLSESDWWVRLPSALFGAGCVLLLGMWVSRMAGAFSGIAAAAMLAVCPLHVCMSQEARPYALMFFLALSCGLLYIRAREQDRLRDWTCFAIALFAMLMTRWTDPHFVVLGFGLHAIWSWAATTKSPHSAPIREWRLLRNTAAATFVAYLMYAPIFFEILRHMRSSVSAPTGDWTGRFIALLYESFAALFAGYSHRTLFVAGGGSRWFVAVGALLLAAGLVVAWSRAVRHRGGDVLWFVFIPFPLTYGLVYALLGNAVPKPQYLLLAAIPVFACIAMAMDELARRKAGLATRSVVTSACVIALCIPMGRESLAGLQRTDKRDWRGAMGFLRENANPGDVAVCVGSDTVPPAFRPKAYGKDRYGPAFLKFVPVSVDTPLSAFEGEAWRESDNRVWILVYADRMYTGTDRVVPPVQAAGIGSIRSFHGLFVVELRPGAPALQRMMDTFGDWYAVLPAEASLAAPAVLRWRYAVSQGDAGTAGESLALARRQCASPDQLAALERVLGSQEAVAVTFLRTSSE